MRFRGLIIACFILTLAPASPAASPFQQLVAGAQLRDAAVDHASGKLFAAAFDKGGIWVYDPSSFERIDQLPAGQGPVALAISQDGAFLACANRLDGTVSLYRLPEGALEETILVEKGPSAIAALPDSRFAVANTFADSVSVIDPYNTAVVIRLDAVPAVPVGIAASENYLAIVGRVEETLYLLARDDWDSPTLVALDGVPKDVHALSSDRFVVQTGKGISLVEARTGTVSKRSNREVSALAAAGDEIFGVEASTVIRFSSTLDVIDETALSDNAGLLVSASGILVAMSPAKLTWQVWNRDGLQLTKTSGSVPLANQEMQVVEAGPAVVAPAGTEANDAASSPEPAVPEESAVSPPAVPAAPPEVPETAQPPLTVSAASSGNNGGRLPSGSTAMAVADRDPVVPAAGDSVPSTTSTPTRSIRQHPVRTEAVGVPRGNRRPSAVPLRQLSRQSITEALTQPTEFGSTEAGFQAPDWTQPFEDVEWDEGKQDLNTDMLDLRGNVRLRLGDMYFRADAFQYAPATGDIHAEGNVYIEQEASTFTADRVDYEVPEEIAIEDPTILQSELTQQDQERMRLSKGRVLASMVNIEEPTRSLRADNVEYDFATSTGTITHARGQAGVYYYAADEFRMVGPMSVEADDVWVTTCDHDPPHYKIRLRKAAIKDGDALGGTNMRLQLGGFDTPFFMPKWKRGGAGNYPWTLDFDSGRLAEIGYYVNVGQRYELSPDLALGPRVFITEKEGVGFGADLEYDFMKNPSSRLYRTQGEAHGLYTTEDRGYLEAYHRYEYDNDLVLRAQVEQWSDRDFYKDFFYDNYRNRTTPRTFANVTYRKQDFIATGTLQLETHGWITGTERIPEASFHYIEHPLGNHFYLASDTTLGYYNREPRGTDALRAMNTVRLTYDWDPLPALSVTPFIELESSWYSNERRSDSSATRISPNTGVTLQTRFHKEYPGRWGFSAFKHVVVPSMTFSYRPSSTVDVRDVPHFDVLDTVVGRSRVESKISNILYGRDEVTSEVWQVGRLTLYQGNDLWNETKKSSDYELEMDLRPRPWWGTQFVAERHDLSQDFDLDPRLRVQDALTEVYEALTPRRNRNPAPDTFDDYSRVLAQVYYDQAPFDARIGFSYTETESRVFNREVLYGAGYDFSEKWGIGFEHRYDFEDGSLRSQSYEIRRSLHCWETSIRFRDRESGFDIDVEFNIKAFPGTRLKF